MTTHDYSGHSPSEAPAHTPADSLQYLAAALPLDWAIAQLDDRLDCGVRVDLELVRGAITTARDLLDHEAELHRLTGRPSYSNGRPAGEREKYPTTELDPETGAQVPVIAEAIFVLYPDGGRAHPSMRPEAR